MKRQEFLKELQARLEGELSPSQVQEHVHFYDEYIREGIREGRTEEEMTASLGSPLLIAKSILETMKGQDGSNGYRSYSGYGGSYGETQSGYGGNSYGGPDQENGRGFNPWQDQGQYQPQHNGFGAGKWVGIVIAVVVIVALFSILGSVMALAMRFFFPILLVVLVVSLVRRGGRR